MNRLDQADGGGFTRRASLVKLGGVVAAALGASAWKADASDAVAEGPAGVASGAVSCVLTPEQTEGPYYIANEKVRRDITEGKPGAPLTLRTTVVDASTCKAIKGASVDIWHCDAGGVYSGFAAASTSRGGGGGRSTPTDKLTFLRGIQRTDGKALAVFDTIYPGWYAGRTVHIHVKVHIGGNVVHTGQLYFPDTLTDAVYAKPPYTTRGAARTTRNANDSVFVNGGRNSMLAVRKAGADAYVATITMGVHRS